MPVAVSQKLKVIEDTPVDIVLSGSSPVGGKLVFQITRFPKSGRVDYVDGIVTYRPNLDFNGPDSFGFRADNGIAQSAEADVSIDVEPVNDSPIAVPQVVRLVEGSSAVIRLSGYDADGDQLAYMLEEGGGPVHGVLEGVPPHLVYRPTAGFSGEDRFRFRVKDAQESSGLASVKLFITPANHEPVAYEQGVSLDEDSEKEITLLASDADSDSLSFSIVDPPSRGTLTPVPGDPSRLRWIYRPRPDLFGADRFTFRASDGTSESAVVAVFLDIRPVNDAPVAEPLKLEVLEDQSVPVIMSGSDREGSALAFRIIDVPLHGRLLGLGSFLMYHPDPDFNGSDVFHYRVNDGSLDSPDVAVLVTVKPVNDPPKAVPQIVATMEDTPVDAVLDATDPDGTPLTTPPTVVQSPANGTLEWTGLNFRYKPKPEFNGTDRFTYWVTDGVLKTAETPVTIVVASVNDVPSIRPMSVTTPEDSPLSITFPVLDADGDLLTYRLLRPPEHGTLTRTGASWSYLPSINYNGKDAFTYVVGDGIGDDLEAVVSITVTPVDDPPTARPQTVITSEEEPVAIRLEGFDAESDPPTFQVVIQPTLGTLSEAATNIFVYTPRSNAFGVDRFTFVVRTPDGSVSSSATVVIQINPVNDRPRVEDRDMTVAEDGILPIALRNLASDIDGDPLRYTVTVPPTLGTLTGTPPDLVYRPFPNVSGNDGFRFRVNDGSIDSPEGVVSINVTPVNDPPVAVSMTVATVEETPVSFTVLTSDVEGDLLSGLVVKGPEKGELRGEFPDFVYIPRVNASGSDAITLMVSDNPDNTNSQSCRITIQITPVNDNPSVESQRLMTGEDTVLSIGLVANDPDGDALKIRVTTGPSFGELVGSGTNYTYRPGTNWSGVDSFRFLANDGTVDSFEGVVSIEVVQTNDVPVAYPQKLGLKEDGTLAIQLTATDVESSDLMYRITVPPSRGVLTGIAPRLVYIPNRDANGADSFGFRVNDGTVDSVEAVVSITVDPVNDAPVARPQTVATEEDQALTLILEGSDVENDVLRFTVTEPPTLGTLSGSPPNLVYTPKPDAFGVDRFQFRVNDGQLDSGKATVVVAVNPVNDVPVVKVPKAPTVVEASGPGGADVSFEVSAMDVEDGALKPVVSRASGSRFPLGQSEVFASAIDSGGSVGTASFVVKVVDTTPPRIAVPQDITVKATGPQGALVEYDSLIVTDAVTAAPVIRSSPPSGSIFPMGKTEVLVLAIDDVGNEGQARFSVTVLNEKPVALGRSVVAVEDVPLSVGLSGADAEGGDLSFRVTSAPKLGSLSGTAPHLVYTPSTNVTGVDRFRFRVSDGDVDSDEAEIVITITPVNDAPVASPMVVTTLEDTEVSISLKGSDAERQTLSFRVTRRPLQGILTGTPPNLIYKPDQNANGSDRFGFRVDDGQEESEEAEVTVMVAPVNDAPIAVAQSLSLTEDVPRSITLSGTDVEGSPLTYSVVSAPTKGRLSGSDGVLVYTPNTNAVGADSFTYRANDGQTNSLDALVTLSIQPVNDPPEAVGQEVTIAEDTVKSITLNAKDAEGDPLLYTVTAQPNLGSLTGTPPNLVYRPATNASGVDAFRFKVSDGALDSAEVSVSVRITPVNDAPVAIPMVVETVEETPKKVELKGKDVEGDPLSYVLVNLPQKGILTGIAPDLVYVPNTNATGTDTFTFKVRDGLVDSSPATVSVVIAPLNDPPNPIMQEVVTLEDVAKAITLGASDPDGDKLVFMITVVPEHGVLSGIPPNVIYRPATNWSGVDRFRFKVSDSVAESVEAAVSITVNPVNDAPLAQSQTVVLMEDSSVVFDLTASDAEDAPLRFILSSLPSKGLLSGTPPRLTYTPDEDATGTDSFTYRVNDGSQDSVKATVTLTIQGVNDAPVALPQSVTVTEDVRKPILLQGNDVDGDRLIYSVTVPPVLGTLSGVPPNLTYTPRTNVFGSDRFSFRVQDGSTNASEATVSVKIDPVNDAPVIQESAVRQIVSGAPLVFQVAAIDPEVPQEQRLSFELVQGPEGFTVSPEGRVDWMPLSTQGPGNYSAEIRVTDNGIPARSSSKVLQFQMVPKNAPPTLTVPIDRTIPANTQFTLALSAFDADLPRQNLVFKLVAGPPGMTVSSGGQLAWKAPAAVKPVVPQVVKVEVSDGWLSTSATFRLSVVEQSAVLPVAVVSGSSPNRLVMTVFGVAGTSYTVESRPDLRQAWTPMPGVPALRGLGMDKPVSVELPLDASTSGFFRIKRP